MRVRVRVRISVWVGMRVRARLALVGLLGDTGPHFDNDLCQDIAARVALRIITRSPLERMEPLVQLSG